jgi:hypothetical protein
MKRKLAGVIVLTVCALTAVFAQTLPAGVAQKASMGGMTEYDFPNGLRVLLYPDPADPKITVNVTAFRKHIDPDALSIVKAGDFKTAGAHSTRTAKNPR